MTGTLGGALEARQVPAGEGFLTSEAVGEIEKDEGVLVVRRIHVTYHLKVDRALLEQKRDAIDRAMAFHADRCPVARTVRNCIDVSTSLEIEAV